MHVWVSMARAEEIWKYFNDPDLNSNKNQGNLYFEVRGIAEINMLKIQGTRPWVKSEKLRDSNGLYWKYIVKCLLEDRITAPQLSWECLMAF